MFDTIFLSPIKILYLLICLLPLALLSGPFIPDLIVSLISVIFLSKVLIDRDFTLFHNKVFKFFLVYCILIITCSLFSDYKAHSLKSSLPYIRFLIFSLAVCYVIAKDQTILKYFTIILISVYVFALINGFLQYFYGYNIFGISPSAPNRLTLVFNERMLGTFLSRTFPLVVGLVIYTYKDSFIKFCYYFY